MTRTMVIGLAILTISASGALAAQRTYHRHPMNAYGAMGPAPMGGGAMSNDHVMYLKNLHDSGYNPRGDYDAHGVLKTQ